MNLAAKSNYTKIVNLLLSQEEIEIGNKAFKNTPIKEITIPCFIKSIGDEAFNECMELRSVLFEVPSSCKKIGKKAFNYCVALNDIEIPESVTSIGKKAFFNCMHFKKFRVPRSVTDIGKNALKNCGNLDELIIPSYFNTEDIGVFGLTKIIKY